MVKASAYIKALPEPWEVPKLRQKDVLLLYETFTSTGIPDKEALDEVESRLIARLSVWLDLNNLREYTEFISGFELGTDRGLEAGEKEITLTDGRKIPVRGVDVDNRRVVAVLKRYGMESSDAWGKEHGAYAQLVKARDSRNDKKRMIAIDRAITIAHFAGWSLVHSFIESDPIRADEFLTELSAGRLSRRFDRPEKFASLQRRPPQSIRVRVRSHRRRR